VSSYQAFPLTIRADRAEVASKILNEAIKFETVFTDYARGCDDLCGDCDVCLTRKRAVAQVLLFPDARAWEVWDTDEGELVGLLYLTSITPGEEATAHYCFFDRKLKSKTDLIAYMINWCFTDHDDWAALKRITVEIPDFAFALARHAFKSLGFSGDFVYERDGVEIMVEGVKRSSLLWRGQRRDLLILGRLNSGAL
jgi:hypothetical protein